MEGFFLRHARSALVTLQRDFLFFTLYRLATCFFKFFFSWRIASLLSKWTRKGLFSSFFFCIEIILGNWNFKAKEWIFDGREACTQVQKVSENFFPDTLGGSEFWGASILRWEFKILRSRLIFLDDNAVCECAPFWNLPNLCRSLKVLVGGIFVSVHLHVRHVTFFRARGLIHLNESLQKIGGKENH